LKENHFEKTIFVNQLWKDESKIIYDWKKKFEKKELLIDVKKPI
jgi:hypothetical protein